MDHGRRPHSHYCRCHVAASGSTEFQKILESEEAGIVIYRYVPRADGAVQKRGRKDGEAFIIRNTKKTIATSDNLTAAFGQNKLTCPRCIRIVEHAQSMVKHIPLIESGDVVSICDSCRRKGRPRTSCRCTEIMNKFLSGRQLEERETRRQRIKIWLKRVQHLLQSAETYQIEENKPKTRARSELSFDDVFSDFIKSKHRDTAEKQPIQRLGASLDSLQTQTDHVRFKLVEPIESSHPKISESRLYIDSKELTKHFSSLHSQAADKSVHLPKIFEPESIMDISLHQELPEQLETKPKRSSILKPEKHIRSRLQLKDSLAPEKERRRSLSPLLLPWKHYSQEQIFKAASDQDISRSPRVFTFSFPKEIKKDLQHYASSSELIKTTQDMLNEKDKRKREELKNKREEKELIKRASEEREDIKKSEYKRKIMSKAEQGLVDSEKESLDDFEKQRLQSEKISITKEKKDMTPPASPASSKPKSKKVEQTKIQETKRVGKAEDDKNALKVIKKPEKVKVDKETTPKKTGIDKEAMPKKSEEKDDPAKREKPEKIEGRENQEKTPKDKEDKVQKQIESKPQPAEEEKPKPPPNKHHDKTEVSDSKKPAKEERKKDTAADDSFKLLQAQKEKEKLEQEKIKKEQQKETDTATKKATEAEKAAKDTRGKAAPSMKLIQLKDITEKPTPEVSAGKTTVKEEKPKAIQVGDPKLFKAQKDKEKLEYESGEKVKREQQKEIEQAQKRAAEAEKVAKDNRAKEEAAKKLRELKTEKPEPEIPKPPPRKPETPTTKELSLKEVKLKKSSDDLILKLVKIKQSEKKDRERTKEKANETGIRSNVVNYEKTKHSPLGGDSESDFNEIDENKPDELHEIIIGAKLYIKHNGPLNNIQECGPIPIVEMKEIEKINDTNTVERPAQTKPPPEVLNLTKTAKTTIEVTEPEGVGKGVIRYALSDRTFIDKGWTMLPTEKVVRKMNVYRMRPAHPEFDWFEHNKNKRLMQYDSGEKLAEFDNDGRGRWYYRSGMLALDYYNAEEINAQQRFVVYSSGEPDERGRTRPRTILATFDYLGNGVVFDHTGKIRLKYNQTEGVVLDRSIGPVSHWKWHTLNDPPVLQQVMIDTQMPYKDANIAKLGGSGSEKVRPDNEEMLAIEFDNFIKEKSRKLTQKFKPFQIRMKALKINEYFSLRVLDQATVYLLFRDGTTNLKINIGMVLDHKEIVDTDTAEVGEVSNSLDRLPARTDSLAELQHAVAQARHLERLRVRHERRLKPPEPCGSADQLRAAISRPLRQTLITDSSTGAPTHSQCRKPSSSNLYYDTRI